MPVSTVSRTHRRAHGRWEAWQHRALSQRVLSEKDRREGYTVLRVPPPLRSTFLDLAWVFVLYDRLFQHAKRPLTGELLVLFQAWAEATQALVQALKTSTDTKG